MWWWVGGGCLCKDQNSSRSKQSRAERWSGACQLFHLILLFTCCGIQPYWSDHLRKRRSGMSLFIFSIPVSTTTYSAESLLCFVVFAPPSLHIKLPVPTFARKFTDKILKTHFEFGIMQSNKHQYPVTFLTWAITSSVSSLHSYQYIIANYLVYFMS